eukprot:scaffold22595_cov102-Cylindrotheca_fusiformis.AAC.6
MDLDNRLFRGTDTLSGELSKWKGTSLIPPKRRQAVFRGGAFLFLQDATILMDYDEVAAIECDNGI